MSDAWFDKYAGLRFERRDHGILLITIDRPEHKNATDAPLHNALSRVWLDVDDMRSKAGTSATDKASFERLIDGIEVMVAILTGSIRRGEEYSDYFMSAQFAGLAVALRGGAYKRAGIEVQVLPLAGAGETAEEIQSVGRDTSGALVVGSTEQNILIPAQRGGAPVKAVASMFGASPLGLAGLPGLATERFGDSGVRIGVHDDTVDLVKRLLPSADVVSVGREEKMGMLIGGKLVINAN